MIKAAYENGVYSFKGIPYAKPPVGERRFCAPELIEDIDEEIEYSDYAPISLQHSNIKTSEDCLYLNVFTTSTVPSDLPVLVWVHGGGYTSGNGNVPESVGERFAKEGIVFVSVNYRVGLLGFLNLPSHETSCNNGFLDLVAVLKFLKKNVHKFGGSNEKITVMGQSAGAKSIASLLFTELSEGLFNRMILQSGAYQSIRTLETASRVYDKVSLSLKPNESLLDMAPERILEIQDEVSVSELSSLYMLGPTIDGKVFKESPEKMLFEGKVKTVPCIIGVNRDECNLFLSNNPKYSSGDYDTLFGIMGKNADIVKKITKNKNLNFDEYAELLSQIQYKIHSYRMASYMKDSCYFYRFDKPDMYKKASHAQELPYIWNSNIYNILKFKNDTPLSKLMFDYWCAFVKGKPMIADGLSWPILSDGLMMFFDNVSHVDPFVFDFDIPELGDAIYCI